MSGEQIALALGLRKAGAARWLGPCPCCGYRSGFSLTQRRDELPLVYCNAGGCGQSEVIAALRSRALWPDSGPEAARPDLAKLANGREAEARKRQRKIALAADMWAESYAADGTLVESYLRSRDIR